MFSFLLLWLTLTWCTCPPPRCLLSIRTGLRQHQRAKCEALQDQEAGQRRFLHHITHTVQQPAAARQPLPQWVRHKSAAWKLETVTSKLRFWTCLSVSHWQSTLMDCVTVWQKFVQCWSLRLRAYPRMPGRSPGSPSALTLNSDRAASEKCGWVSLNHIQWMHTLSPTLETKQHDAVCLLREGLSVPLRYEKYVKNIHPTRFFNILTQAVCLAVSIF